MASECFLCTTADVIIIILVVVVMLTMIITLILIISVLPLGHRFRDDIFPAVDTAVILECCMIGLRMCCQDECCIGRLWSVVQSTTGWLP